MVVEMTHNTEIFSRNRTAAKIWNQERSDPRQAKDKNSTYASNRTEANIDDSNTNRGFAMQQNRYSRKKFEFVYEALHEIN